MKEVVLARVGPVQVAGYSVVRKDNLFDPADRYLADLIGDRSTLVVTGPTVAQLFGARVDAYAAKWLYPVRRIVIESGDPNKTVASAVAVCQEAMSAGIERRGLIVALGGGTVIDVVAFAASMYRRGVPHLRIGTTVLSQVDAAVGVKCGVNFAGTKNLLGSFHPPEAVLLDGQLLASLPQRQVSAGLAEVVKLGAICDVALFRAVEDWVGVSVREAKVRGLQALCARAAGRMSDELNKNLFEYDLRRAPDFGHTISPLLETASDHSLNHGEAVAIDMASSMVIGQLLGYVVESEVHRFLQLLLNLRLPVWSPLLTRTLYSNALAQASAHRGGLNMPFPSPLGSVHFLESPMVLGQQLIDAAIDTLRSLYFATGNSTHTAVDL